MEGIDAAAAVVAAGCFFAAGFFLAVDFFAVDFFRVDFLPADFFAAGFFAAARAAAHLVLARRRSRIALFDLRETVQGAKEPLAMEFLAALEAIGDASCVDALAKAFASTPDRWWRGHLAQAFRAIVRREKLTRRHAAVKRLEARDPLLLKELWPPTRP